MAYQYLFNSRGQWIAFKSGRYIFNRRCQWIGWLPFNNEHVMDRGGQYLGTIVNENRLFRYRTKPLLATPPSPMTPANPATPATPAKHASVPLPAGAEDVVIT